MQSLPREVTMTTVTQAKPATEAPAEQTAKAVPAVRTRKVAAKATAKPDAKVTKAQPAKAAAPAPKVATDPYAPLKELQIPVGTGNPEVPSPRSDGRVRIGTDTREIKTVAGVRKAVAFAVLAHKAGWKPEVSKVSQGAVSVRATNPKSGESVTCTWVYGENPFGNPVYRRTKDAQPVELRNVNAARAQLLGASKGLTTKPVSLDLKPRTKTAKADRERKVPFDPATVEAKELRETLPGKTIEWRPNGSTDSKTAKVGPKVAVRSPKGNTDPADRNIEFVNSNDGKTYAVKLSKILDVS